MLCICNSPGLLCLSRGKPAPPCGKPTPLEKSISSGEGTAQRHHLTALGVSSWAVEGWSQVRWVPPTRWACWAPGWAVHTCRSDWLPVALENPVLCHHSKIWSLGSNNGSYSTWFNVVRSLQCLMELEQNKLCFCMWKEKGRNKPHLC